MEKLTLKIAERQESGLILEYIKKLADYEKRSDEVIATSQDIEKWVFDEKSGGSNICSSRWRTNRFCTILLKFFNIYWKCKYAS